MAEYIEREALIKAFSSNGARFTYGTKTCDAIISRINWIPAVNEWIDINEKRPKPYVSVLGVMTDAGPFSAVRECHMVSNGNFYFYSLSEFHPISHWMPMPKPPKTNEVMI